MYTETVHADDTTTARILIVETGRKRFNVLICKLNDCVFSERWMGGGGG